MVRVIETTIPGLKLFELDLHMDARGWFWELWNRQNFRTLGLENFFPVQANSSHNFLKGTTRGIHAEPWNKLVAPTNGEVFCAWLDLRQGSNFGQVFTASLKPGQMAFVPKGVGNSYQTLTDNLTYGYLVDEYWSANADYKMVNAFDESLGIAWPIAKENAIVSEKDQFHPPLIKTDPFHKEKIVIFGPTGQLGSAILRALGDRAHVVTRQELECSILENNVADLIRTGAVVVNAIAYTDVNAAEDSTNRAAALEANFRVVKLIAAACEAKKARLIHFSSDYVFDGTSEAPYSEEDLANPINFYGLSKLLGDEAALNWKKSYVVRLSWLLGPESGFLRMIKRLLATPDAIRVVEDQVGKITFLEDIVMFTLHLIENNEPFGLYNFTSNVSQSTWFEIAQECAVALGYRPDRIEPQTTVTYLESKPEAARRPLFSALDTRKAFNLLDLEPADWRSKLREILLSNDAAARPITPGANAKLYL